MTASAPITQAQLLDFVRSLRLDMDQFKQDVRDEVVRPAEPPVSRHPPWGSDGDALRPPLCPGPAPRRLP